MTTQMTQEQMQAMIAQMAAERDALVAKVAQMKADSQRKLSLKVSDKGALSVYGLGRFPVTLYRGQWERLLDDAARIRRYIEDNASLLTTKD